MPTVSRSSVRRWLPPVVAALVGTGLAGLAAIGAAVAWVRLLARGRVFDEDSVPPAPVALVLGAQVYPDGTPSPFLAARLDVARRLFEAGAVHVLLVSGDNMAREYDEPDAMRAYLVDRGVPPEKVVADYAGFDTYDSCARAQRIFGVDHLVVVSQGYHLPRAIATCRALGIDAVGVGDESFRGSWAWRRGALRDQVACVKTVWDVVSGRDPVLGQYETSVDRALRG